MRNSRSGFLAACAGLAAAALGALMPGASPAAAADSTAPTLFNFSVGDCNGVLKLDASVTDTLTPTIQIAVQDLASGLKIGRAPFVSNASSNSLSTVLLLDFNEASGTSASDYSGNNLTGTLTDTGAACPGPNPCRAAGQSGFGNALTWPGTPGGHVKVNAAGALASAANALTLQAWVNLTDTSADRPIIEFNNGTLFGVHLWASRGGAGNLFVNFISSQPGVGAISNTVTTQNNVLTPGTWHLVTAVYGDNGHVGKIYVDDVMKASRTFTTSVSALVTNFDLYVGRRFTSGEVFNGSLDQIRVLNTVLTAKDVEQDFHSGRFRFSTAGSTGPFTTTLLASGDYVPAASQGTTAHSTVTRTAVPLLFGSNNFVQFDFQDRGGNSRFFSTSIQVATAVPGTPDLTGTPAGTGSITWAWTAPAKLCASPTARLYDCTSPAPLQTGLGIPSSTTEGGFGVNTLQARRLSANDVFGEGSLSSCTSAYTEANPPGAFLSSNISTGSMTLEWGANGNPAYTRFELGQWNGLGDGTFTTFVSSPITLAQNVTSTKTAFSGLSPATTYFWRVTAHNGRFEDPLGGRFTTAVSTLIPTLPTAPSGLAGSGSGTGSVSWTWNGVPTAIAYTLLSGAGAVLTDGGATSFTQGGLAPNSAVTASVRARNQSGSGPASTVVTAHSDAQAPTGLAVTGTSSTTITVSWNPGANPGGTTFEVFAATDSSFTGLISTRSGSGSALAFGSLLPGTTYFLKVRALSGDNVPTSQDGPVQAVTGRESAVTISSAPPTPYVAPPGAVGIWHFDEGASTQAADSSGAGNHGTLTCVLAACSSTPTFTTAGTLEGMGAAASFNGQIDALVSVPHSASLDFGGPLTVEAWVHPTTSLQTSSAGVVAKGSFGDEAFALDVVRDAVGALKARLVVRDNTGTVLTAVTSTQSLQTGAWTHLAGVYEAPFLRIFVNGTLSQSNASGPASRRLNTHLLSIGSRQSGAGPYDLSFSGNVDEVRVLNVARTAAEVLSDFNSGKPAAFTLPSPNDKVSLTLPPNAFNGAATIYVSSSPLTNPVSISQTLLANALLAPPTTAPILIPGTVVEIVAQVGGQIVTSDLGSPATVGLSYPDADGNGLIDGINPPIAADSLKIFTVNTTVPGWIELTAAGIDKGARRVSALTPHFSVFALFGGTGISETLAGVHAYPVPWTPGSGDQFDSALFAGRSGLVITNLPSEGDIRILTISGELVRDLAVTPFDAGRVVWDGRNRTGKDAASGVYLAVVKAGSATKILRLVLER